MRKLALVALAFITIVACKNNTKTEKKSVTKEEKPNEKSTKKTILDKGCYEYNSNDNTIKMEITEVNENVTGNLNIAYAEKDANQGTFVGNLNDDKLFGTYTFNAEGKESSREIAFLVKGNQLIEGFGELNDNGTKFKDVNTIKYNSSIHLTKVDCNQ
ncbi:hypothetical protein LCGC14_0079630 [marine sediment metagenome]|uniref:Lipoprotein n=1 Tax=marine sediment metagenome TaxID=412755 RepID=A0A0F9VYM0_9ZZZZ|nr:hypothetical protein [Maribacter sp.]HDZ04557.1 hypothetical protein [Maribacter sp.]HEA80847.1 hypothetical protein [Maribacter sp.]